ncbi:MAG: type IV secretion system DNA-binding domain-containing protein [Clostridia bacterium]|nr:type IV secretion system DNA-binding domain-containing protein [Clostridia bacterium]
MWLKKKLKDNELMCKVFYAATALVLINRVFTFIVMMLIGNDAGFYRISMWSSYEYTLAFLLPLAGFAHFCSSSYAKNRFKKVKMFSATTMMIATLAAFMLAEWSNQLIWYFLSFWGSDVVTRVFYDGYGIVSSAVRYGTVYFPLLMLFITSGYLFDAIYWPDSKGQLLNLTLLDNAPNAMPVGEYTCEVAVCKDALTGKPVVVPENRRMEATLIQGATGTGKTSTLLLPMCASDIEKKFFFREQAKKAAIEALDKGYAYIEAPFALEELNDRFSLSYIKPALNKEEEFNEIVSKFVKYVDPMTGETVYKDLGVTVVEPDGKFCSDFKKVAANFGIEVKSIDPQDPNSYGMNPFQIEDPDEVASIIATVLQGMYESENPGGNNIFFGQVTQQALENLAILLKVMYPRMHDGQLPTLEDMLKMLYDYNIVELMCEELKKDPELAEEYKILVKYFEKNFYNPPCDLNGRPIQGTVGSGRKDTEKFLYGAATQLDNLMRHDMVKQILCSRDKNLDFDEVLRTGQCVSVCTRRGELGALLSKPFGMFFILSLQAAVLRRPGTENTRIPHFLYIDEFPDFVNKETETCFTLFRKYRCAMIVAIQNLSQLARTESMKFYKQVVVSNTKTQLVFGDTNVEDSDYWSDVYGRREVLKVGNSLATTPMAQVKEGSAGVSGEDYGARVAMTEKIKPHALNQLPFKTLYYVVRDAKGNKRQGKGKTDFLKQKYKEKHEPEKFDFTRYRAYFRTSLNEGYWNDSISAQEAAENRFLEGQY